MIIKLRELLLALVLAATAAVPAAHAEGGPTSILINYHCEPANRPAFRIYLQHDLLPRLAKLKQQGVLSSYQILFNPFTQPACAWRSRLTPIRRMRPGKARRMIPGATATAFTT